MEGSDDKNMVMLRTLAVARRRIYRDSIAQRQRRATPTFAARVLAAHFLASRAQRSSPAPPLRLQTPLGRAERPAAGPLGPSSDRTLLRRTSSRRGHREGRITPEILIHIEKKMKEGDSKASQF